MEKKKDLATEINEIEGSDIVDSMLKQRRDWVQWYRSTFNKPPDNLDKFYTRNDLETPLSPEEEEKKAAEVKFMDIAAAKEVLSDPEKRKM